MELTYDWVSFQDIFNPRPKGAAAKAPGLVGGTVYAVVDGDRVIEAFAENEDLSEWVGGPQRRLAEQFKHRTIVALKRTELDRWLSGSLAQASFHDQIEAIRGEAQLSCPKHFLVEALEGRWSRFLPVDYGLLIRVEGSTRDRLILLRIRRGKVEAAERPDLTGLPIAQARQPAAIINLLSDRYRIPVQGLFTTEGEWLEWMHSDQPWKAVRQSVRAQSTKVFPERFGLKALLSLRVWVGL